MLKFNLPPENEEKRTRIIWIRATYTRTVEYQHELLPTEVPELKSVEYWSMKRLNSELCGDFELLRLYIWYTHSV